MSFPTVLTEIKQRITAIDPISYAKTRNYLTGKVTRLSPYLSRGFISLTQVKNEILKSYTVNQAEKLLQELAWREYYQRVWQEKGDLIFTDLKQVQQKVDHYNIPDAVINAATGISAIDRGIELLYSTGYMHNHLRMYTAMLSCNIAKAHWLAPAQWMYYYLLDGDLASNALSWQWVAGSFSTKKYVANQENINKYTGSTQTTGFLSIEYDAFDNIAIPDHLTKQSSIPLSTTLPASDDMNVTHTTVFVYNSYQLDPEWHIGEAGERILLLEPSHFEQHPVSNDVIRFIVELGKNNIPGLKIFTGSFQQLYDTFSSATIYYKEHPLTTHYKGIPEPRSWLFPEVSGYYPSFFSYWKKCEKYMR